MEHNLDKFYFSNHGTLNDFNNKYDKIKKIGSGKQSKVYLCKNKQTNKYVVGKYITYDEPLVKYSKEEKVNEKTINDVTTIENMILIYKKISITNECSKYTECFVESFVDLNNKTYIIICNYIKGFNLGSVIIQDEHCILKLAKDILESLIFIHELGISHNDLYLENIMYDIENDRFKIIDFGFSCNCNNIGINVIPASPESNSSVSKDGMDERYHRSDLWSLGIILYKISTGNYPWFLKKNKLEDNYKIRDYIIGKEFGEVELLDIKGMDEIDKELDHDYKIKYITPPVLDENSENDEERIPFDLIKHKYVKILTKALLKRDWRKRLDIYTASYIVDELLKRTERKKAGLDCFFYYPEIYDPILFEETKKYKENIKSNNERPASRYIP